MLTVTRILSAILKSVVDSKVDNEFVQEVIGIAIDETTEDGINVIKSFIKSEQSKIKQILSKEGMLSMNIPENHIVFVTTEIRDLLNKIKISDDVLRECKYNNEKLTNFMWNEYVTYKCDYIENESDIRTTLTFIAKTLMETMQQSEKFCSNMLVQISNTVDEIRLEERTSLLNIMKKLDRQDERNQEILNKFSQNYIIQNKNMEKRIILSRTREFVDKWNENMFLNDFDEWDEKRGVNIKLKDLYLKQFLPNFIWKDNTVIFGKLSELLAKYLYNTGRNKMLLILGQPGIGKSTLITWMVANYPDQLCNILIYKFAPDLSQLNSNDYNFEELLLSNLNLRKSDLSGKILILDGFDEINIEKDRVIILNQIFYEFIKYCPANNFSLIITCRENYIYNLKKLECDYITLQQWNGKQIQEFFERFQMITNNFIVSSMLEVLIEKKEIFGIPLILYMVLALNINIRKEGSIVDVYDQIFSVKDGGIYSRCIGNCSYEAPHRISIMKEKFHQITRDIAIWIFENNNEEASIEQAEFQLICRSVSDNEEDKIEKDVLIGNYFKRIKYCEKIGDEAVCFAHRSIYEYFVAETIYNSIEDDLLELSDLSKIRFAKNIPFYLKCGILTQTINDYLVYKIIQLYNTKLNDEKRKKFYEWIESTIEMMMKSGMFFYTQKSIDCYNNIITKENTCFLNLIIILRKLKKISTKRYILENVNEKIIRRYLRIYILESEINNNTLNLDNFYLEKMRLFGIVLLKANLKNVYLVKADLRYSNLIGANLKNANLSEAKFRKATLMGTNMMGVNLQKADLYFTNMIGVNLKKADLREANLENANLTDADLENADLRGANLENTNLTNADLENADLRGVNLVNANLTGADLEESIWNSADIKKSIYMLENAKFVSVKVYFRKEVKKVNRRKLYFL